MKYKKTVTHFIADSLGVLVGILFSGEYHIDKITNGIFLYDLYLLFIICVSVAIFYFVQKIAAEKSRSYLIETTITALIIYGLISYDRILKIEYGFDNFLMICLMLSSAGLSRYIYREKE